MATSGLGCGKPSLPLHKLACKMDLSLCKGSISEHWLSSWTPVMNKFLVETQISDPQLTSISTVPELCLSTLQGALWTRDLWINLNITTCTGERCFVHKLVNTWDRNEAPGLNQPLPPSTNWCHLSIISISLIPPFYYTQCILLWTVCVWQQFLLLYVTMSFTFVLVA